MEQRALSGNPRLCCGKLAVVQRTVPGKDPPASQSVLTGIARKRGPKENVWAPVCMTMPTRKSPPSRWAR